MGGLYSTTHIPCEGLSGIRMSVITTQGKQLPLNSTTTPIYRINSGAIFNQELEID